MRLPADAFGVEVNGEDMVKDARQTIAEVETMQQRLAELEERLDGLRDTGKKAVGGRKGRRAVTVRREPGTESQ